MQYIKRILTKVHDYLWSFFCSAKPKVELIPLDPRQRVVYEDYMAQKDLQELNDIFSYVRNKENAIKTKCKLR